LSHTGHIHQKNNPPAQRKAGKPVQSKSARKSHALAVQRNSAMPGVTLPGYTGKKIQQKRTYNPTHFFNDPGIVNGVKTNPVIQTSIPMGKPGDKYEVEADAAADKVMQMPSSGRVSASGSAGEEPPSVQQSSIATGISSIVSRKEDDEKEPVQSMQVPGSDQSAATSGAEAIQSKCTGCQNEEKAQGAVQHRALHSKEEEPERNKSPAQASLIQSQIQNSLTRL
jgi:hypothetical protein